MIVDEIMSDCGWTDVFFKEQIKPICDASIVELNIAGVKTICDSDQYSFEEYIPDPGLRSLARRYIAVDARLQFDPPQNSKQIEQLMGIRKQTRKAIIEYCNLNLGNK